MRPPEAWDPPHSHGPSTLAMDVRTADAYTSIATTTHHSTPGGVFHIALVGATPLLAPSVGPLCFSEQCTHAHNTSCMHMHVQNKPTKTQTSRVLTVTPLLSTLCSGEPPKEKAPKAPKAAAASPKKK
jgi:hypothetical protein